MSTVTGDVEPAGMSPDALADHLSDRLEERVRERLIAHGQLTLTVEPAAVPMAVQLCRDDPALAFDFFDFLTAVDEREDGFAVVIHLYSTRHRHHVQIRALPDGGREAPTLPTISHLYAGANWHERETYDMFGITFDGHPGLLPRILTVENFEGFPLRKEFLLMTREVKPWPGLKEPTEVAEEEDGDGEGAAPSGPSAEEKARMAREKAERAKAKAAEARKRRARERSGSAGASTEPSETETPAGDGAVAPEKDAALDTGAGDDQIAGDPQQAAAIADDAVAKDAAAGAVGGDTAAGASGDVAGEDQPVEDEAREAELARGAEPTADATPGVEAQADDAPDAATTPEGEGDTDDTDDKGPLADVAQWLSPQVIADAPKDPLSYHSIDDDQPDDEFAPVDDGGAGLPPRGPGQEEPRALADDGVDAVPLADEVDAEATGTVADRPEAQRPSGTDADDRLRDLEDDAGEDR